MQKAPQRGEAWWAPWPRPAAEFSQCPQDLRCIPKHWLLPCSSCAQDTGLLSRAARTSMGAVYGALNSLCLSPWQGVRVTYSGVPHTRNGAWLTAGQWVVTE